MWSKKPGETERLGREATSCVELKRRGADCEKVFIIGVTVADGATSTPRGIVVEPAREHQDHNWNEGPVCGCLRRIGSYIPHAKYDSTN
jgi:hypothetical protein